MWYDGAPSSKQGHTPHVKPLLIAILILAAVSLLIHIGLRAKPAPFSPPDLKQGEIETIYRTVHTRFGQLWALVNQKEEGL